MDTDGEKIQLASLRGDFNHLRQTLGVSGTRRLLADIIDGGVAIVLAIGFLQIQITPWIAMGYFLVRDLPPMKRSVGKMLTGIKIYSANDLTAPSSGQLIIRGTANLLVVFPVGVLLVMFFVYAFAALAAIGILVYFYGGDSWILRGIGYNHENGQAIADRRAGTHLIQPRDLESLALMADQIEQLRANLCRK